MSDDDKKKADDLVKVDDTDAAFDMDVEDFNAALESGEIELNVPDEDKTTIPDGQVDTKPATGETFTITHNGVEHNLTRDKVIEFAQKGFDYDTKVGPHRRIVQLLDSDPTAQQLLNQHFLARFNVMPPSPGVQPGPTYPQYSDPNAIQRQPARQPDSRPAEFKPDLSRVKVKKLREYDDESDWMEDNIGAIVENLVPQIVDHVRSSMPGIGAGQQQQFVQQPVPTAGQQQFMQPGQPTLADGMAMVQNELRRYDPQYADMIIPHLDTYADGITAKEYREATSSIYNFFRFYDKVKADVLEQQQKGINQRTNQTGDTRNAGPVRKRFNLKAGGGNPPQGRKKVINVWDLGDDEFDAMVSRMLP